MRRPPTSFAAPAFAALALAAAGCGAATDSSEEFEGPRRDVATVVEDLETAAREDEPRRVCQQLLARSLTSELGDRCPQAVQQAFDEADTTELEVTNVRISGDTARAEVDTGRDEERREVIELVREDDAWRISSLGEPA